MRAVIAGIGNARGRRSKTPLPHSHGSVDSVRSGAVTVGEWFLPRAPTPQYLAGTKAS